MIEAWFPQFVFFEDVPLPEEIRSEAVEAIEEKIDLRVISEEGCITANTSANDFHFDPRIRRLLKEITPTLDRCFYDELKIDRGKARFYIGRCWPVIQIDNGASGIKHYHRGATFSSVMYLEVPEGAGSLEFYKPGDYLYDHLPKAEHIPLTYLTARYQAAKNRILIFPSEMEHRRHRNEGEGSGKRLAIAFDIFATSDVADYTTGKPHPESEIELKDL